MVPPVKKKKELPENWATLSSAHPLSQSSENTLGNVDLADTLVLHVKKVSWCFRTAPSYVWSSRDSVVHSGPSGMDHALKDGETGRGRAGPKCLESTRHCLLQSWLLQLWFISRRLHFYPTLMSSH